MGGAGGRNSMATKKEKNPILHQIKRVAQVVNVVLFHLEPAPRVGLVRRQRRLPHEAFLTLEKIENEKKQKN